MTTSLRLAAVTHSMSEQPFDAASVAGAAGADVVLLCLQDAPDGLDACAAASPAFPGFACAVSETSGALRLCVFAKGGHVVGVAAARASVAGADPRRPASRGVRGQREFLDGRRAAALRPPLRSKPDAQVPLRRPRRRARRRGPARAEAASVKRVASSTRVEEEPTTLRRLSKRSFLDARRGTA